MIRTACWVLTRADMQWHGLRVSCEDSRVNNGSGFLGRRCICSVTTSLSHLDIISFTHAAPPACFFAALCRTCYTALCSDQDEQLEEHRHNLEVRIERLTGELATSRRELVRTSA